MKILKNIIISLIVGFICFISYNGIMTAISYKKYGYHPFEVVDKPNQLSLFNDSINEIIKIESSACNNTDTIYILSFQNRFQLIYWIIGQYKSLSLAAFKQVPINSIDKEGSTHYCVIGNSEMPFIDIHQRAILPSHLPISLSFMEYQKPPRLVSYSDTYKYYITNSRTIVFSTNQKFYDILITRYEDTEIGFLLLPTKYSCKILLIVPKGNEKVNSGLLSYLLNEKIFKN
jgi:hypothetical protein